MRTYAHEWNWRWATIIAVLFMLGGTCVASAQTSETPEQRIERLRAEEAKRIENETPRDRLIRLRAEEIRIAKARKEAEEKVKALDSPEMKQARKEIEKAEKREKKANQQAFNALATVDLHGCEPGTVWINSSIGNSWELRKSSIYSMVSVTIVNRSGMPVDITSSFHGDLIRGLCSGGQVTIPFSIRSYNPSSMQVTLTATTRSMGAGTQVDSRIINLYRNSDYNSRRVDSQLWELVPR